MRSKYNIQLDKRKVCRADLRWVSASITEECYYGLLFTSQVGA